MQTKRIVITLQQAEYKHLKNLSKTLKMSLTKTASMLVQLFLNATRVSK